MNIYHRIYKLYQRKIPAQQIAATTHMPLQSVKEIIKKFEGKNGKVPQKESPDMEAYLDYHVSKHNKYTVLDFSGFFLSEFKEEINIAIIEIRQQLAQTLAIKMHEVVAIDEEAMAIIVKFAKELNEVAKNLVILSPSDIVEEFIIAHNIEEHVLVFGTLSAFEEHAFNLSHGKK